MSTAPPPTRVEARGVLCPVPIIRLARAARGLPPGSLIELLSDDPAAAHDVPAWCRLRGHTLVMTEPCEGLPSPSSAAESAGRADEPVVGRPRTGQPLRHLIRLEAPERAA